MWFRRSEPKVNLEAEKAIRESKKNLEKVQAREAEVHEVAEASRKFRRENHFATDLQHVFGGPKT